MDDGFGNRYYLIGDNSESGVKTFNLSETTGWRTHKFRIELYQIGRGGALRIKSMKFASKPPQ